MPVRKNTFTRANGGNPEVFNTLGTSLILLSSSGTVRQIEGGTSSGDDLTLKANQADAYSKINIQGADVIQLISNGGLEIYNGSSRIEIFEALGGLHILERAAAPSAISTYGCLYVKNDDTLHYIDGGGVDHTIAFV